MKDQNDKNGTHVPASSDLDQFDTCFPANDEWDAMGMSEKIDGLLAFDGDAGPQDDFDDLSRRRWIHEVIARFESGESSAPTETPKERKNIVMTLFAAAAAIAVIAGGMAVVSMMETEQTTTPAIPAVADASFSAESLLVAGEARVGDKPLVPGQVLEEGAVVTVDSGQVALALPSKINILLEKGSKVEFSKLNKDGYELSLKSGSVLASVDPKTPRPGFAVRTDAGTVMVTGTVFSVRTGEQSDVRVLRGSVRLDEPGRAARSVKTRQGSVLGGDSLFEIPAADVKLLKQQSVTLDMLDVASGGSVTLNSDPSGASVYLDGSPIGSTPLTANVKAGSRSVEVSKRGHRTVRELVDVPSKGSLTRRFKLEAKPVAAAKAPVKATPKLSAANLLKQANEHRVAKRWKAAAGSYEDLLKAYPRSGQARIARISLADIQLDHLRQPAKALRQYNAYLKGGGSGAVAQEASHGRIRALRAMGKAKAEKSAIEAFLTKYPRAISAPALKKRLAKLK